MSSLCNKLFLFIKMKHALGSVFSPNTRTQNFELLASWHDCAGSIKEARNQAHFISTHESKLTLSGTRNPYVIYCGNIKPWFLRTYCRLLHQSCLQSLASIFRLGRAYLVCALESLYDWSWNKLRKLSWNGDSLIASELEFFTVSFLHLVWHSTLKLYW